MSRYTELPRWIFIALTCGLLLCSSCRALHPQPTLDAGLLGPILVESFRDDNSAKERLVRIERDGVVQRYTTFEEYNSESDTYTVVGIVNIGIKAFTLQWHEQGFTYKKNPVFDPLLDPSDIFGILLALELNSTAVNEILKQRGLIIRNNEKLVWKDSGELYLTFENHRCESSPKRAAKGTEPRDSDSEVVNCHATTISYAGSNVTLRIRTKRLLP